MKITFTPNSRFDTIALSKLGDTLTINGEDFDFSPLPEGYSVSAISTWIIGPISREGGELKITIACPTILKNVTVIAEDGDIGVPTNE
ncbi:hypothetical protein KW830_02470 [Comamonas sp. CMM03]|uniref:hypothetical protein n=1 Tax=Comamonas sp. CMM03 TaxID=2854781 RepID=UPI001C43EC15|nr:hypothetical protein [Comamonas sp. CMM03]MBV7417312.1 hypothetical protein [Comamonas sp. CMM03]